ncbi:hypothetical protein FT643_05940 [Ketobacter sp. MCCC 1A13808]|uniref:hypothetical protein n=1 Tax=Ketobacter sp. MCCC 1A13808 TaxID=2602738 RepID=UPI000F2D5D76|nr:hypothetical protein [Ketobacter sp. MCCC 1A13808]MVF11682.1 hypothetical protein [Ketobacter sp. MCCC 1A13808]RLP55295.1 MAG: hypothetical protein D6160_05970 [Ketobacter sp.]
MRSARLFGFCLLYLFSSLSFAGETLSDADIKKWATAYQAVVEWSEKTEFKNPPKINKENMDISKVYSQMLETSKGEDFYKDLAAILKKNGYSDEQLWGQQGDRILMAFMANEMDTSKVDIQKQLQEAKNMMKDLPPEQRAMMEGMLKQSTQAMESASGVPDSDKAAVKRNRALLEKAFDIK